MPLSRISATLPAALVRSADRLARKLGRSRSWVLAEALRRYVSERAEAGATPVAVGEPITPPEELARAFEEASRSRLKSDLALSPEERVRVVEELARTAAIARPQPRCQQILAFDSWEDYLAWMKTDYIR